jgi:predicted 3-demethylubiquinone-9 3-methyltransferase (glyoxalase superfamily)
MATQKITTYLWFDGNAEEAVAFYTSIFPLAGGGRPNACGWLDDKFGLSWQVVPTKLVTLMSDQDAKRAGR